MLKFTFIHRRTSRGCEGGCSPPVTEIFEIFWAKRWWFGQSIREKMLYKVVKARLEGYFLWRLPCQDGVKVKRSKDPGICFGKAIYRLHVYYRNLRDEYCFHQQNKWRPIKQTKTYNLGQTLLRRITKNTYFLHLSWQKCLQSPIKRQFPPPLQCCLQ